MHTKMRDDRIAAEEFPCPYVVPLAARGKGPRPRRDDDEDDTLRCGAGVWEQCREPWGRNPLVGQAAHQVRLKLAGRAAAPCFSAAYPGE